MHCHMLRLWATMQQTLGWATCSSYSCAVTALSRLVLAQLEAGQDSVCTPGRGTCWMHEGHLQTEIRCQRTSRALEDTYRMLRNSENSLSVVS